MFFQISILFVVLSYFYFKIPSPLEPVLWTNPSPLLSFNETTRENNILSYAYKITGDFTGPESIAFNSNGLAYVSLSDGTIGLFSSNGSFIEIFFFVGGFIQQSASSSDYNSNGISPITINLQEWCKEEALAKRLAWNVSGEALCGRPLGLRFREENEENILKGYLYAIDAYHGLFKINTATKRVIHLVRANTPIQVNNNNNNNNKEVKYDPIINLPPKFFNDLDISSDGSKIVFSDSSYKFTRSENRQEILDGAARGRLFLFDIQKQQLTVLLCGLHFANGVQFIYSDNNIEEEVVVIDLNRFRALKVNISSSYVKNGNLLSSCGEYGDTYNVLMNLSDQERYQKVGVDYFIKNIPGYPDNIRYDETSTKNNKKYIIGIFSKSTKPISVTWLILQSIWIRDFVGKLIPMKYIEKMIPKYGLVLVCNNNGDFVDSYHDPSGRIHAISQANRNPFTGDLWIGSHSEALAILPSKYINEK